MFEFDASAFANLGTHRFKMVAGLGSKGTVSLGNDLLQPVKRLTCPLFEYHFGSLHRFLSQRFKALSSLPQIRFFGFRKLLARRLRGLLYAGFKILAPTLQRFIPNVVKSLTDVREK